MKAPPPDHCQSIEFIRAVLHGRQQGPAYLKYLSIDDIWSMLQTSMNFYERLFGQPPSKIRSGYANFRLDQPPIHLALVQAARASTSDHSGTAGSHSHFGIELPARDTFVAWRERLREAGAQDRDERDAVCCYARADKVWFSDPDGNAWEVWVRTGEAEQMRNSHSECCVAA